MASKCDEEEISFTNQVVKDKIVFPVFLVTSSKYYEEHFVTFPTTERIDENECGITWLLAVHLLY